MDTFPLTHNSLFIFSVGKMHTLQNFWLHLCIPNKMLIAV